MGAGRLISVDHIAQASIRVMGTCYITGQAAGVAAGIQSIFGSVDVGKVQQELLSQKALL